MDKTFFLYMLIGCSVAYLIITNVNDIQEKEERYQNKSYQKEHKYDKYYSVDSIGEPNLNIIGESYLVQKDVWNNCSFKKEYITLFPIFEEMISFVETNVLGEPIKTNLIKLIKEEQDKFISGEQTLEVTRNNLSKI